MVVQDDHGSVYLNSAEVPRWNDGLITGQRAGYFTMVDVDVRAKRVLKAEGLWVTPDGQIAECQPLFPIENESISQVSTSTSATAVYDD